MTTFSTLAFHSTTVLPLNTPVSRTTARSSAMLSTRAPIRPLLSLRRPPISPFTQRPSSHGLHFPKPFRSCLRFRHQRHRSLDFQQELTSSPAHLRIQARGQLPYWGDTRSARQPGLILVLNICSLCQALEYYFQVMGSTSLEGSKLSEAERPMKY